jgi:hypothetical protein
MWKDCQKSNQGLDETETMRSIGSPFKAKGRLRAFLKDPLRKELGNYST